MRSFSDELYHYGVKGMKWGVIRSEKEKASSRGSKGALQNQISKQKKASSHNIVNEIPVSENFGSGAYTLAEIEELTEQFENEASTGDLVNDPDAYYVLANELLKSLGLRGAIEPVIGQEVKTNKIYVWYRDISTGTKYNSIQEAQAAIAARKRKESGDVRTARRREVYVDPNAKPVTVKKGEKVDTGHDEWMDKYLASPAMETQRQKVRQKNLSQINEFLRVSGLPQLKSSPVKKRKDLATERKEQKEKKEVSLLPVPKEDAKKKKRNQRGLGR